MTYQIRPVDLAVTKSPLVNTPDISVKSVITPVEKPETPEKKLIIPVATPITPLVTNMNAQADTVGTML